MHDAQVDKALLGGIGSGKSAPFKVSIKLSSEATRMGMINLAPNAVSAAGKASARWVVRRLSDFCNRVKVPELPSQLLSKKQQQTKKKKKLKLPPTEVEIALGLYDDLSRLRKRVFFFVHGTQGKFCRFERCMVHLTVACNV